MTPWRDASLSIADDLFLVAVDERTGRIRLHQRALALGLAGGLLAELGLGSHIQFGSGQLTVPPTAASPTADHHRRMRDQIAAEPQHSLSTWLSFFAQTAPDVVSERLVKRGFLDRESSRGLLRTKETYRSTDDSALAWRTLRLANIIAQRDIRNWEDGVLVGLLDATGLADHVLWHGAPGDMENLRDIVTGVGEDPFFHALITGVSALVASGVMTQRR